MIKKDLSKEVRAYALKNALEFGKAESSKILPKLFQHGLEKNTIKDIMPTINAEVSNVNDLSDEERLKEFEKLQKVDGTELKKAEQFVQE